MLLELISQDYDFESKVIIFFTFLIALVVSMTIHEFAHAFTAIKCGDPTPKSFGRNTLNPLAHIEPLGFISFLLLGFGWAKPVPINTLNFRHYKRDTFLVSVMGVVSNIILAFLFMPLVMLVVVNVSSFASYTLFRIFLYLTIYFVTINVVMFVFNLFPIYPLDGFNAMSSYMRYENKFVVFMRKYGTAILLALLIVFDVVYNIWEIDILSYICFYVSWPLTKFWSWVFGYGALNFNYLGLVLFGIVG